MKILIADDEKMMRTGMEKEVKKVLPDADIFLAESGPEALKVFGENDISLAFLDVEMPGMSGLEVAENLRKIRPDVNIVMTTAYPNYAVDAYKLHIGGYLMKPVDADDIREELNNLIYPMEGEGDIKRLKLICFGDFRAEYGGEPLRFSRSKSKEILAYLTARNGDSVSRKELCDVLWEDEERESKQSYIRVLLMDLKKTLKDIDCESVLINENSECSLKVSEVDCDYYEFLKGDPDAIRAYSGKFMSQYSWGEEYIWDLEERL